MPVYLRNSRRGGMRRKTGWKKKNTHKKPTEKAIPRWARFWPVSFYGLLKKNWKRMNIPPALFDFSVSLTLLQALLFTLCSCRKGHSYSYSRSEVLQTENIEKWVQMIFCKLTWPKQSGLNSFTLMSHTRTAFLDSSSKPRKRRKATIAHWQLKKEHMEGFVMVSCKCDGLVMSCSIDDVDFSFLMF